MEMPHYKAVHSVYEHYFDFPFPSISWTIWVVWKLSWFIGSPDCSLECVLLDFLLSLSSQLIWLSDTNKGHWGGCLSINSRKVFGHWTVIEFPFPSGIRMFSSDGNYFHEFDSGAERGDQDAVAAPHLMSSGHFPLCCCSSQASPGAHHEWCPFPGGWGLPFSSSTASTVSPKETRVLWVTHAVLMSWILPRVFASTWPPIHNMQSLELNLPFLAGSLSYFCRILELRWPRTWSHFSSCLLPQLLPLFRLTFDCHMHTYVLI